MPKASPRKRERIAFLLDADKLGLLAGAFCAVVVMGACFYQDVGGFEVAFRVVVTLGLTYVAVHVLVRAVLQPALGARIVQPRPRKPAPEQPLPDEAVDEPEPPEPGPEEGV